MYFRSTPIKFHCLDYRRSLARRKILGYSSTMFCSMTFSNFKPALLLLAAFTFLLPSAFAADAPTSPDVVTFVNGEKISGQLQKVADGKVYFHSDMVGDVSFEWSKVKELKTAKPFAVIAKDAKLRKKGAAKNIPEGTLEVGENKIAVNGATTLPTDQAAYIVDQPTFDKQVAHNPGILQGWIGAVTAGVSLVEATQNNQNITTAVALSRRNPALDWISTRSRTTLDFTSSYGKVTQPGTPDVKTNIFHAEAEQDEYLTDRLYGLGHVAFDHNFSQGLDLQQLYGGGFGYTAIKDKVQELDFKADLHYEKQQFATVALNQNLFGSEFAQSYTRKLPRAMVFTEGVLYNAAWNNLSAYSAQGLLGLSAPLAKRFSLSINLLDGFLNNPPPGFKKNSLQFTTGLTYTLK